MADLDRIPVLVGGGQFTEKDVAVEQAHSPLDLMQFAVQRAVQSAGLKQLPTDLNNMIVVNSVGVHKQVGRRVRTVCVTA